MIILAKLELTLLISVTAHVHVVFRLTRILWVTLIVLFSLTALHEPSASQNWSLSVLSHSFASTGGEYIFYVFSLVFHFSEIQLAPASLCPLRPYQTIV